MVQRDSTNQSIDNGNGDAFVFAPVAGLSGGFMVQTIYCYVRERAQIDTKFFKLGGIANPRQDFLPNQADKADSAFGDQFA